MKTTFGSEPPLGGTKSKTACGKARVAFDIFDCSGTPIGEAWGG